MKDIRIEPDGSGSLLIDVVCNCGSNNLADTGTGKTSMKHKVALEAGYEFTLKCSSCGREYLVKGQTGHIHVFSSQVV